MIFDKAFVNGRIYTMEAEGEYVEAVLINNGKIIMLGSSDEVASYDVKERIDLKGKTVLPGFIDTHMHLPEAVDNSRKVDLCNAKSIYEVQELLKKGLESLRDGMWLLGR
ncbi:MAG: amidohydrolase family protein, partial [Clostridiales bacterium]|nr:amidohydrolase family protein [Clostridiales bacterium]